MRQKKKATINPSQITALGGQYIVQTDVGGHYPIPQMFEFDIAVTASEGKEAKAGVGVFTGAVGLGTQGKIEGGNSMLSRIKFSVQVVFPQQHFKK